MSLDLLATCWTHSGNSFPYPGNDVSSLGLMERARAVSDAGYTGIGSFSKDLAVELEKRPLAEIARMLEDLGLAYIELEFLPDWWTDGPARCDVQAGC